MGFPSLDLLLGGSAFQPSFRPRGDLLEPLDPLRRGDASLGTAPGTSSELPKSWEWVLAQVPSPPPSAPAGGCAGKPVGCFLSQWETQNKWLVYYYL